ncbi:hypothetical protein SAVIM338S_00546 [Streptomyces avidinii]
MDSGRKGPRGGRAGVLARGAVALVLACAGMAAGPVAARAAAGPAGVACAADAGAEGRAGAAAPGSSVPGSPVPGSLVSVARGDGRISQVRLSYDYDYGGYGYDAVAAGGPPHVWHREQAAPDSAYGPWRRVGRATARPGGGRPVSAAENAAGRLEVVFPGSGGLCRTVETGGAGSGWSTPTAIGRAADVWAAAGLVADGEASVGQAPVGQAADGRAADAQAPWDRIQPNSVERLADNDDGGGGGGGPRLDVGRTTGLLDGDIVTFGITGGPPKAYVWVKQCGPSASAATCDDATGRQFRVYPDGTYQLSPKKVYAQLDAPAGQFDCRRAPAGNPCSLALTDNAGAVLATVPLRFRPDGRPEAPPTLRVSPDTGLVDGRTVRATGKGYEPQYHSLVMECAAGSADTLGCRPRSRPPATDDKGRIDEQVTLSATFTSIDGRAVDCRTPGACELVVFGTRVRGPESVRHPLEFAPAAARP